MRTAIALHNSLAPLGAPPTVSEDYVSAVMRQSRDGWRMYMNGPQNSPMPYDVPAAGIGDCTCADSAHQVMLHSANVGTIVIPSDDEVLAEYEAVSGYIVGDASTDTGADETSVCDELVKTGLAGLKLDATAMLDPTNLAHIRWAVQIFGACRLGIIVDQRMMDQFDSGQPWDTPAAANDKTAGGHDVPIVRYDAEYAYVVTWGKLHPVTWALIGQSAFLEEAHAGIWSDWAVAGRTAPDGFDMARLVAELAAIRGRA